MYSHTHTRVFSGGADLHGGHGNDHRRLQPPRQQDQKQIQQHPGLCVRLAAIQFWKFQSTFK